MNALQKPTELESLGQTLKVQALALQNSPFPPAEAVDLLVVKLLETDTRIKQIAEAVRVLQAQKKALESYRSMVQAIVTQSPVKSFEGNEHVFQMIKSKPSVVIEDETLLAGEFFEIIPAQKIARKEAILQKYVDTREVPAGAKVVQGEYMKYYPKRGSRRGANGQSD